MPQTRIGARWVWMALIALVVLAATYMALVRTYLGQYLENAALLGAKQATTAEIDDALGNLNVISMTSLVVMCAVFALAGFIRKSWRIAAAGIATLGIATVITEALKRYILVRPELADIYQNNGHNSFPSGHTTIAMSILVGLLLVTSYRWRGLVMLLAMGWAVSIGAATVTARWHRFSDTLGADMVALGIGALVALWLLRSQCIEPREDKRYPLRVFFVIFFAVAGAGALVTGAILVWGSLSTWDVLGQLALQRGEGIQPALTAHLDPVFNDNMFYAAQSLAFGFSTLSALWFWGTFHRIGTTRP